MALLEASRPTLNRADAIERMRRARNVHEMWLVWWEGAEEWERVAFAYAGDGEWQRFWVQTYEQVVDLLQNGCACEGEARLTGDFVSPHQLRLLE